MIADKNLGVNRIMTGLLRKFLRPGEFYAGRDPVIAETLVGSCVAVCLFNRKGGFGAMNHFLMDRSKDPADTDIGRYGLTSTCHIVDAMLQIDPEPGHYHASVFGGAAVLKAPNVDSGIGSANVGIALEILRRARIRVTRQEVGGTRGRRIRFNTQTGETECRFAGDIPRKRAAP